MTTETETVPFRLDGKVALVTGAGSGIGERIAHLFARQGAAVVIGDVSAASGNRVAEEVTAAGGRARYQPLDVTDGGSTEAAVAACVAAFGGLHVLVNNAGIGYVGDALETDEAEYDRLMAVNVKGVFLCSRAALRHMVAQGGGVIVNIASVAGMVGVSRRFAYGASKGAVIAMTKSLAMDFVERNVRVNCICPGTIHTPFVDGYLDRFHSHNREETLAALHARQPVGRMGRPDDVAYAALYLASEQSSFATGSAMVVDGGLTAR